MTISTDARLSRETGSFSILLPLGLLAALSLLAGCNGGHGAGGGAASWAHGDGSKFGWIEVYDDQINARFLQATMPPYDDNALAGGCVAALQDSDIGTVVSAGDLSFTIDGQAPFTVTAPGPDNYYSGDHTFTLDPLTVHASGDAVPAFDVSLTPSPAASVQLIQPPLGSGAAPAVSRTSDLALTWKGGTSGVLMMDISSDAYDVICVFPAADGHATIPSTALAVLPVGQRTVRGRIGDIMRFNAGDYQLSLVRWLDAGILGCDRCSLSLQP